VEEKEMKTLVPLLDATELQDGQSRSVQANGRMFAVFNQRGQFYVLDDECPHVGAPLGSGFLEEGQVVCSFHGWTFDLKSGACLTGGDCRVNTYRVQVRDGKVHIEL
jgi:nitrite reductase/ring-hydroxylating ferredoxin subunit